MKRTLNISLALLVIVLMQSNAASAKLPGMLQRLHLGYSFVINSAEYQVKTKYVTPEFSIDTSYKYDMKTSAAFGYTIGTYFPLKRLGRVSKLVLGVDYMYNLMLWDSPVPIIDGTGGTSNFIFSGGTLQMALPIGLDFKFGCDALTVKNNRFCATLGVGALPTYSVTTLDNIPTLDGQFGVAPYAKVEAGIFAGICMKVRAIYSFGNTTYFDKTDKTTFSSNSTTLVGKSNLTISLLVMPFSWAWDKEEWWNTLNPLNF